MTEQDNFPGADKACGGNLYLDGWIRSGIISRSAASPGLKSLPFRQLVLYGLSLRLADTLERVLSGSLHYSLKFSEKPGRDYILQAVNELRQVARLCLTPQSMKTTGLIEMKVDTIITSLPFTWPEELAREPESFLAVSHNEVEAVISQYSSGSTGPNKRIFCSESDLEATIGFFMNGMRYMVEPGGADRVAMIMVTGGPGRGNLAEIYAEAMARLGVPCMTASNPADECLTLHELADFRPSCIVATPRQLVSLFRSRSDETCPKADQLVKSVKSGLKKVLLSGDRISSATSRVMQKELGVETFLHYGMVESGIGTAVECGCHEGAHYREGDLFIEILSPDGVSYPSPVPARQTTYIDPDDHDFRIYGPTPWGEITITTLTREANPLIRYRTGDIGRIIVDRCACGSEVWRLELRGRKADYIQLPVSHGENSTDVPRLIHSTFDRCLFYLPWIKDHQVCVYSQGEGKTPEDIGLTLLVNSSAPEGDELDDELRAALAPVEYRLRPHDIGLYFRAVHSRAEFELLHRCGSKRIFIHKAEPIDRDAHVKF